LPLFYILSGIGLTLMYGKKTYVSVSFPCCCLGSTRSISKDLSSSTSFDYWQFIRNRFARIAPVYYFCIIIAIPLIFLGHSYKSPDDPSQIRGIIEAMLALQAFVIVDGTGPNGAGWTISLFVFFYLIFPW
jgi:peptidoglycan/LPS O-acetylase OafA/YrhL